MSIEACPITQQTLNHPMRLVPCRHNVSEEGLQTLLGVQSTLYRGENVCKSLLERKIVYCPTCHKGVENAIPNYGLQDLIDQAKTPTRIAVSTGHLPVGARYKIRRGLID